MSEYVLGATPPFERHNPAAAGVSGLCLGPLGLAIYLQDWRAIVLPAVVACSVPMIAPGPGLVASWAFCGAYGYLRVQRANKKADAELERGRKAAREARAMAEAVQLALAEIIEVEPAREPPAPLTDLAPEPPTIQPEPAPAEPSSPPVSARKRGRPAKNSGPMAA